MMIFLADVSSGNPAATFMAPFNNVANWGGFGYPKTGLTGAIVVHFDSPTTFYPRIYSYLPGQAYTSQNAYGAIVISRLT
jgi:hypothetical protein